MTPGEISVGFTCRVKVESPSAPHGSTTSAAGITTKANRPSLAIGGAGEGGVASDWHPVLCHRPLVVSVFSCREADAKGLRSKVRRWCDCWCWSWYRSQNVWELPVSR